MSTPFSPPTITFLQGLKDNNAKVWFTPENPTAEWMAAVICAEARKQLEPLVRVDAVRVHETDTGYAEYRP